MVSFLSRVVERIGQASRRPGGSGKRIRFKKLNEGWNAEPNAPDPKVKLLDHDVLLEFFVNSYMFDIFEDEDVGVLRFSGCSRYRLGPTNDEGWNRGQCRYSRLAPAWGEFYEIFGDDRLRDSPSDWIPVGESSGPSRHFLFYLRDEAFEAIANDWRFDTHDRNALLKLLR